MVVLSWDLTGVPVGNCWALAIGDFLGVWWRSWGVTGGEEENSGAGNSGTER